MFGYILLVSVPIAVVLRTTLYIERLARRLPDRNEDFNVFLAN